MIKDKKLKRNKNLLETKLLAQKVKYKILLKL